MGTIGRIAAFRLKFGGYISNQSNGFFGGFFKSKRPNNNSSNDNLLVITSCNNVAPVTNLYLGRSTMRSHSSQWGKKKVAVET